MFPHRAELRARGRQQSQNTGGLLSGPLSPRKALTRDLGGPSSVGQASRKRCSSAPESRAAPHQLTCFLGIVPEGGDWGERVALLQVRREGRSDPVNMSLLFHPLREAWQDNHAPSGERVISILLSKHSLEISQKREQ